MNSHVKFPPRISNDEPTNKRVNIAMTWFSWHQENRKRWFHLEEINKRLLWSLAYLFETTNIINKHLLCCCWCRHNFYGLNQSMVVSGGSFAVLYHEHLFAMWEERSDATIVESHCEIPNAREYHTSTPAPASIGWYEIIVARREYLHYFYESSIHPTCDGRSYNTW